MKRPQPGWLACRPPLVAALLAVSVVTAGAAGRLSAEDGCVQVSGDEDVAIASIDDDLDVTLADGRRLRLVGLDPPRATLAAPDLPARAGRTLSAWAAAGPLTVHRLAPAADRWGRWPAQLFHATAAEPRATDVLLRAGMGRARPEPAVHACFDALLAAEGEARAQRLGLWADPRYAILVPALTADLVAQAGDMALAEGVLHIHDGRGALYLALGRDRWGLTAIVSRRDVQRFAKAGFALRDYDGTPVRLRGDLDMRFGPRLHVTESDAIESLEPGSVTDAAEAPKHWTEGQGNR